ncbi:wall-associated receptor kinase-like 22 [Chenopodium quinoa]|uniref:wall-associated receptor kinase-like 22 n=1 Tax=Chenopodium quinoa TaxID=63459 RepID=UPI000B79744B|nr:wall-associated receptor kinase-like 22 [Chenopodium quinoa]
MSKVSLYPGPLHQMGQTLTKGKIKNKRKPKFDSKEEYFIKNGGILLEKQVALSRGHHKGDGQLKIFSSKDIEKATNNHNPDHFSATDGHYIFYRATIDDRDVAIKAPSEPEPKPELMDHSLTAASTVMVMNHANIIKLYGCCLETFIPIVVYEFPPCANLFDHFHSNVASNQRGITWIDRLRVATGTAYALSYMHTALPKPVVHRNVKSLSVFFDDSFRAILANFGYSVSITPGENTKGWPVKGTPGYLDPEYVETREVTDKCDVYSFGVLLLELLTRRPPCVMAENGIDLVSMFISMVEKNLMMEIIDSEVLLQASRDDIQRVAQLALKCVAKEGVRRPTMVEVVRELWLMQDQH